MVETAPLPETVNLQTALALLDLAGNRRDVVRVLELHSGLMGRTATVRLPDGEVALVMRDDLAYSAEDGAFVSGQDLGAAEAVLNGRGVGLLKAHRQAADRVVRAWMLHDRAGLSDLETVHAATSLISRLS